MDAERHARLTDLFTRAADLDDAARAAFLGAECADDAELRAEVEALFAARKVDVDFLDAPQAGGIVPLTPLPAPRRTGSSIGPYRIEGIIASGGMGTVYRATQERPRRTVAIKVLRSDIATAGALRRFEFEAELLGRLQHPGIAEIHAAGVFQEAGRTIPYFALEYIAHARPITTHARSKNLSLSRRLELFVQLCDAVQYAHNNGVIHRDLKPDNILIGETGQPKVIDFGVARARATDGRGTLFTQAGQLVGTLAYMSPEQVSGDIDQVDTRSDVYALGILLYELLSDKRPLDLEDTSLFGAIRIIKERDPTRLGLVAPEYRGDIETIVAKALEKDRQLRYDSPAELAADIRRFLDDEPITARPQTTLYQLRKLARRNRGLCAGLGVGAAALLVSLVVAVGQAVQVARARDAARLEEIATARHAYRASVSAAVVSIENHDIRAARKSLAGAPADLRGWEWRHLVGRLDHSEIQVQLERDRPAEQMWFALDGAVCTLTAAETVCVDLATRAIRQRGDLRGQGGTDHECVADGDAIIVRARDGRARRFDLAALGIDPHLPILALSSDGRWLVLANRRQPDRPDPLIRCDVRTGAHEVLATDPARVHQCAVGSNGAVAIINGPQGLTLWPAAQPGGVPVAHRLELPAVPRSVRLDASGQRAVVAMRGGSVAVWDTASGTLVASASGAHGSVAEDAAFSPDGTLIASVGTDRAVRLWTSSDLRPLAVLHGHERGIVCVGFSPDGRRLATIDHGHALRVWAVQLRPPGVLGTHDSIVYPVAISADGSLAATAGWDDLIRLWDLHTGSPRGTLPGHGATMTALAFAPSGDLLVSLGQDGLRARSLESGREVAALARTDSGQPEGTVKLLSFAGDDDALPLPWTFDRPQAMVWHARTGELTTRPRALLEPLYALSPDGRYLVDYVTESGRSPASVRADTACAIQVIERASGTVCRLPELSGPFAFAPHEPARLVARLSHRPTEIGIWDLGSGAPITTLVGHTDNIYALAFAPDGQRLATAGRDSLRLWDGNRYEEIVQLRGHRSFVWALAFSPDGRRLLSTSGDFTVRCWDAPPLAALGPEWMARPVGVAPGKGDAR